MREVVTDLGKGRGHRRVNKGWNTTSGSSVVMAGPEN